MQFKREISLCGLLMIGIGSIIGSGWLFGPLYAAQIAGPGAMVSWIIGGVLMIIVALTFAELGSAFPIAGSMVQVAQYSHGPLVSFIIGWLVWISSISVAPVETMAIIQYAGNYVPGLVTKVNNSTVMTGFGMSMSAIVLFLMCLLNYFGARFFSISNNIITFIKLIMPFATAFLLIAIDFHTANFYSAQSGGFQPYGWHGILAALPLGGVIYSLLGANNILQIAAETKNPQRNIPLALIGAIAFCAVTYFILQFAFIGSINPVNLVKGWANLSFPGDSGPFAGILAALGLGWFVAILYVDAIISPFGTGLIYIGATARVNYGLSKIGFFHKSFEKLTNRGVPLVAIIINYIVGLILFLPFPGWQSLVGFVISSFILSYIIGPIALVALRKTRANQPRPFRLPFHWFVSLLTFYVCNLMVFWTGWQTVYHMMLAILIGVVFFIFYVFRQKENIWAKQWRVSWWLIPYLVGISIISYCGTFGNGHNYIPFGWDFLIVGIFSIIIFILAAKYVETTHASVYTGINTKSA
ncbi:MAG: APC family permease [Proteobacteria bacterium]|nr:APC family permease [Pseudomonadota bacterium]